MKKTIFVLSLIFAGSVMAANNPIEELAKEAAQPATAGTSDTQKATKENSTSISIDMKGFTSTHDANMARAITQTQTHYQGLSLNMATWRACIEAVQGRINVD